MKPISDLHTEFLQTICFYEGSESQKTFAHEASDELKRRGVNPLFYNLDEKIIQKYETKYIELNKSYLKQDSFLYLELLWMCIFFPRELITGHNLEKEETLKRKQRKYAILCGIALYSICFIYITQQSKIENEEYIEQLKMESIKDIVNIASQDWSGKYVFYEASKKWIFEIIKQQNNSHQGILFYTHNKINEKINCSIVIKDFGIQVFSDSIIERLNIKSRKDLLFEFEIDNNDTLTWWHTLKPSNYEMKNGTKGFKKL